MAVKLYGAQTKREFNQKEVQRKARMIVAMLLELRLGPGPHAELARRFMADIAEPMKQVAQAMRQVAELNDAEWIDQTTRSDS